MLISVNYCKYCIWLLLIVLNSAFSAEINHVTPATSVDHGGLHDYNDKAAPLADPFNPSAATSPETMKQIITNNGDVTSIKVICPLPVHLSAESNPIYNPVNIDNSSAFIDLPVPSVNSASALDPSSATPEHADSANSIPNGSDSSSSIAKVDFGALEFDQNANKVVLETEGCQQVTVDGGVPSWVIELSMKSKEGKVILHKGWAQGAGSLSHLYFHVSNGLVINVNMHDDASGTESPEANKIGTNIEEFCSVLPHTLEILDVSHTPLRNLYLNESCAITLLELEASHSKLSQLSLCAPNLVTLHINDNELEGNLQWEACPQGLTKVRDLQARQNKLTEVSTCGWKELEILDIRKNNIVSLDISTCPPFSLTSLQASHNAIVTPPTIPDTLEALFQLDLSNNLLESLPVITSKLQSADFSHNNIQAIGKLRFKKARKLVHLNLSHNNITHVKERELIGLRNLSMLDLSHNLLRIVAATAFTHLRHLQRLYLHHNRLHTLDSRDLAFLRPHAHATLHHNPWECTCFLLSELQRFQHCEYCDHKVVPLKCCERGSCKAASKILHTCLQTVREVTQTLEDESDEDLSEEQRAKDAESEGENKAVVAVPVFLILIIFGALVAMSYRLYHRHKRTISARLNPFCNRQGLCCHCGCSSATAINESDHNHHSHGHLSQNEHESESETEL